MYSPEQMKSVIKENLIEKTIERFFEQSQKIVDEKLGDFVERNHLLKRGRAAIAADNFADLCFIFAGRKYYSPILSSDHKARVKDWEVDFLHESLTLEFIEFEKTWIKDLEAEKSLMKSVMSSVMNRPSSAWLKILPESMSLEIRRFKEANPQMFTEHEADYQDYSPSDPFGRSASVWIERYKVHFDRLEQRQVKNLLLKD